MPPLQANSADAVGNRNRRMGLQCSMKYERLLGDELIEARFGLSGVSAVQLAGRASRDAMPVLAIPQMKAVTKL